MSPDWNPESLLDVLGNGLARRILVQACGEARTADELAEACDAASPTVYRRLDALVEYDLVTENVAVNTDGNNYRTYETAVEGILVDVSPDGIETNVRTDRDIIDRFEAFWVDLEGGERR